MTRKRRTYTKEFKIEAVRLVTEDGCNIREAAESLGVSAVRIAALSGRFDFS